MAGLVTWCRLMRIGPACATPCDGCRIASGRLARAGIHLDPEKFYDDEQGASMPDTDAEPLRHVEELDARGFPTGHARCDTGGGPGGGGTLAVNSGHATCEACIEWEDEADIDERPGPRNGDRATCAACGKDIEFIDPNDALPGIWRHVRMPSDHDAQLGGPA